MIGVMVPSVYAETWYYYVEPLPDYASYANNVMDLSTDAWEEANNDLQFIEVGSPQQADFQVQWVKEFGVEHVGYAFGSWFIEVGLGDSGCGNGMWQPYSEKYTTDIMTHEIGHVLGFDHVNDPDSIMYPTAINWEYGNVETSETLTTGYGYFQPICTSKYVTTFDWHVSSDDPTYGFDVYFVPSVNEFDKWVEGETFNYFEGDGCSAENMLSVGGTCQGVTQDSGLLVIMGDNASEPLTEITLNLQENNSGFTDDASNSEKSSPDQNSNDVILVDNTFALYVDPQQQFSIKYPSNWIIDDTDYDKLKVTFFNDYDWVSQIYVIDYGEIEYAGLSSSKILEKIISYEQEFCDNSTWSEDDFICYDFVVGGSDNIQLDSGQNAYVVGYESTYQYRGSEGVEYPTTAILAEIHDGSNAWTVYAEVDTEYRESFGDILLESLASFEVNTSGAISSTTTTNSIPIPIPQPDVITSAGTAALSKTSVNISSYQSEQVKIYGIVSNVDKSTRVSITYTYPDGTTDGGTIFTTDTGVYEAYLNLDKNSPIGNYEILVTAKGKILGTLILQVNDKILDSHPFVESTPLPTSNTSLNTNGIASFVDQTKDPQHYIDRYNNEPTYKEWFDENYSQYSSIYEAVGLEEPVVVAEPVVEYTSEPTISGDSNSSNLFPDPDKDPREYLIRYYTEPKYQEWFDSNFPNESIEDKVGYPYKIITDEYYVDELFDFSLKNPSVNFEIIEQPQSVNENVRPLVQIAWGDPDNEFYSSNVVIYFSQNNIDEIYYDDLLYYYSNYPEGIQSSEPGVSTQMKINNETLENDGNRDIIRYELSSLSYYPDDYFMEDMAGVKITSKDVVVILLYPNGDEYQLIFGSNVDSYTRDVKEFNKMVDSFYVGKTQNLSDIINTNISYTPAVQESNEPQISEPDVEYISEPVVTEPNCGSGTELVNGICEIIQTEEKSSKGGGCLIATATYGSEMAVEVQQLRELRDNQLLNTESGTAFMGTFNAIYYSFSPIIADYERENPYFKEAVKLAITPMISSLSLMENAESESEVLSIGISVIMLNLGMYLGVPAIVVIGIRKKF